MQSLEYVWSQIIDNMVHKMAAEVHEAKAGVVTLCVPARTVHQLSHSCMTYCDRNCGAALF